MEGAVHEANILGEELAVKVKVSGVPGTFANRTYLAGESSLSAIELVEDTSSLYVVPRVRPVSWTESYEESTVVVRMLST